jgi:hypothetical protein
MPQLCRHIAIIAGLLHATGTLSMEERSLLIIDDRSSGDSRAQNGASWRLFTDGVMGGLSTGRLGFEQVEGRRCLRMQGAVRLENNGGFVQIALDLDQRDRSLIAGYSGLLLDVTGNNELYNVHLRTDAMRLPWQSYRASFQATRGWQTIALPFTDFQPYRVEVPLEPGSIMRLGLVAIGRAFNAELCLGRLAFYR